MTKPLPIREGIVPHLDLEREMIDYCMKELRVFRESAGTAPSRIAIALMGDGSNGKLHTSARTWDAKDESTRIETCSLAALLFTNRAIGKGD